MNISSLQQLLDGYLGRGAANSNTGSETCTYAAGETNRVGSEL